MEPIGHPVVDRALPDDTRATIGDIAGRRRSIILNRKWKFSSENERPWVLAEELGHVLLDHKLVESTDPRQPVAIRARDLPDSRARRTASSRNCRGYGSRLFGTVDSSLGSWPL
jgi:hypothetical protein